MARSDPALERHVKEIWPDLEHLLGAGEAVLMLQGHAGWLAVQEILEAEIATITSSMDSATVLPQADYAARHGRIGGLKAAKGAVEAILNVSARRREEQASRHEADAETPAGR